jgi:hypothetical protein
MEYEVVFEIPKTGGYGFIKLILAGLIVSSILPAGVIYGHQLPKKFISKVQVNAFMVIYLLAALSYSALIIFLLPLQDAKLRNEYANGNFRIVEGVVENFELRPTKRCMNAKRFTEKFTVNGVKFSYFDPCITLGHARSSYSKTSLKGGPILEGLSVRIVYIDNKILKLEVGTSAN